MAERTLADKLLVRAGARLAVVEPPAEAAALLAPLPPGATMHIGPMPRADVAVVFVRDRAALAATWPAVVASLGEATILWLCYPKKTGTLATDLTRDHGWAPVHGAGFDPVTQVALDATWSALRWRRDPALRAAREARGARLGQD